ncbi:MAG: hypothetical protein K8R77_15805 [Anaerolineaceae bacterium]|nr:hypothetical protein [Anaerolineaceae bacterium]
MSDLYYILGMISRGEAHAASVELTRLLQSEPQNVQAWSLMALAVESPQKKIDCYRRILQIDPANSNALTQLKALGAAPEASVNTPKTPPPPEQPPAPKPVTGSLLVNENEVRLLLVAGELHDLFNGELNLRVDQVHLNPEDQMPASIDFRLLSPDKDIKEYRNVLPGSLLEYQGRHRYKIAIARNPTPNKLLAMRIRRIV